MNIELNSYLVKFSILLVLAAFASYVMAMTADDMDRIANGWTKAWAAGFALTYFVSAVIAVVGLFCEVFPGDEKVKLRDAQRKTEAQLRDREVDVKRKEHENEMKERELDRLLTRIKST